MARDQTEGQVVRAFFLTGLRLSTYGLLVGLPLSLLAMRLFLRRWESRT